MALSEEDRLWIEKKRKDIEREERELKRRGIIPYTDEEKEEIEIEEAKMRKQAGFTAEALKKARVSNQKDFTMGSYDYDLRNIARPE